MTTTLETTEVVKAIEHVYAVIAENEALKLGISDRDLAIAKRDGRLAEQKDYIAGLRADHVQMLGIIESLRAQLRQFQSAMRELSPRVEALNGGQAERARQAHAIESASPAELGMLAPRGNGSARIATLSERLEAAGAVA